MCILSHSVCVVCDVMGSAYALHCCAVLVSKVQIRHSASVQVLLRRLLMLQPAVVSTAQLLCSQGSLLLLKGQTLGSLVCSQIA
jgi:hypothetical protein